MVDLLTGLVPRYIMQITMRYAAVAVIAWVVAIALWPWLQTGIRGSQSRSS